MTPDDFWLRAMRDAHRPALTAIEQVALSKLRAQRLAQGTDDRYWAGVGVMRDDGAMQIVPLTIDRVEDTARLYALHGISELFTLTPPWDAGS